MSMEEERLAIINQLERDNFNFDELALRIYEYQRVHNPVYQEYCQLLNVPFKLKQIELIPFLPIQFFKTHEVKTGSHWEAEQIFESSGTTGNNTSRHFVRSCSLYLKNSLKIFNAKYGNIKDYHVLALLPSYLERNNSSLVAMAKYFMDHSGQDQSSFFLNDYDSLIQQLKNNNKKGVQSIVIGVTFALLDFPITEKKLFENVIIVETGGMKGRKKEMTRMELHNVLKDKFGVTAIHSEYGMTELLSQAWSTGEGIFTFTKTMKVTLRELSDPLSSQKIGKTGIVNIIDLANVDSCAFIATDDLGQMKNENQFEILGRVDGSAIRGCNLLYIPQ